jgi:hypothetical protein
MIQDFASSWHLFHNSYLAGWLIGLLLALIGVLVVARNQIFIGVAVSQASTLGIALTMWLGTSGLLSHLTAESLSPVMAVLFSVIAALITVSGGEESKETSEAITGWVFLFAASGSILIVSHSPLGLEEIYRLLSSSIIGASAIDIWIFTAFLFLTAIFIGISHQRLLLFSLDPAMAAAVGLAWSGRGVGHPHRRDALYLRLLSPAAPGGQELVPGSSQHVCHRSPGFSGSRCPGFHPGQPLRFPAGPDDRGFTLFNPRPSLDLAQVQKVVGKAYLGGILSP